MFISEDQIYQKYRFSFIGAGEGVFNCASAGLVSLIIFVLTGVTLVITKKSRRKEKDKRRMNR